MSLRKTGLGKGLDALFLDNSTDEHGQSIIIKIDEIQPNRNQPRKDFSREALEGLADSILQHGLIQPILVRPTNDGGYMLVAGERRWRASMMAGLTEIPAVVKEMTDSEMMELALIENLQREDLNPIEEAEGMKLLMDNHELTHEEIAAKLNKSRETVTNALRLLKLPPHIQEKVSRGTLSASHARTLLSFEDEEMQREMAELAEKKNLSVRALEKKAKETKKDKKEQATPPSQSIISEQKTIYTETALQLSQILRRKVRISLGKQKGTLEIDFYSDNDLMKLAQAIADR